MPILRRRLRLNPTGQANVTFVELQSFVKAEAPARAQ